MTVVETRPVTAPADSPAASPAAGPVATTAATRRSTAAWTTAIISGLVLILVLPLVLLLVVGSSRAPADPLVLGLQLAVLAYSGARLAQLVLDGRPVVFQVTFWVFVYVWLGLAPLVQLLLGIVPALAAAPYESAVKISASLVVLLGLVAFDLGRLSVRRRSRPLPLTRFLEDREFRVGRVLVLALLLGLATPLFVQAYGGVSALFSDRNSAVQQLVSTGLYGDGGNAGGALLQGLSSAPALVAALVVAPLLRRRWPRLWWVGLVAAGLTLGLDQLLFNNPFINSRYWFGTVLIAPLVLSRRLLSPWFVRALVLGALLAAVLVLPYSDYFRTAAGFRTTTGPVATLATKGDFDPQQEIRASVAYVKTDGHTLGRQGSGAILSWVPRSLWSGKPVDTAYLLGRHENYTYINVSAPLWAEAYLEFGWIGVVGYFFIYGAVSADLEAAFARIRRRDLGPLAVWVAVFAGYSFIVLRGSLIQASGRIWLIGLVILLLSRRRAAAPPSAEQPAG